MRIPEPIETPGLFWLPETPDNQLPGVLRISESGEVTLEVIGLLRHHRASVDEERIGRIVGKVDKGQSATLDNCLIQKEGSNLSKSTIYAHLAFIGVDCAKQEELEFSKLHFSVDGLSEWLSISGFKSKHDPKSGSHSIHYRHPKKVPVVLPNGIEMDFLFNHTLSSESSPNIKKSITQGSCVSLSLNEPQSIEYLLSLVNQICLFLSFAVDQNISVEYIRLMDRDDPLISINMYGEIGHYSEQRPRIRLGEILFTYKNIGHQVEQALTAWLESFEKYESAFNLYFASRSDNVRYLDVRFLMLAQGIEILHRKSSREDLILRERVERLVDCFSGLFGGAKARRCFVKKVADTRNYLTHYSSRGKKKAASEDELMHLYRKLEALFQLHLMRLIGFDSKSIEIVANEVDSLRHKLGLPRSGPLLPSRPPRSGGLSLRSAAPPPAIGHGPGPGARGRIATS